MRVATGCGPLDDLLEGGVESAALTEFFGAAGAGKSNVCLQLARNVARDGRKVVFIDTEGVSLERLQQMSGADGKKIQGNILFFEPFSLQEQEDVVAKAVRLSASADVGLIVFDSATLLYRLALGTGDDVQGRRTLASQLAQLAAAARKRDFPVVMTNQVYTNIDRNDELEPVGGQVIRHLCKAVVRLDKLDDGRRRAVVMKHRSVAEGLSTEFLITARGLEGDARSGAARSPAADTVPDHAEP